jgi:hypothetical protein
VSVAAFGAKLRLSGSEPLPDTIQSFNGNGISANCGNRHPIMEEPSKKLSPPFFSKNSGDNFLPMAYISE